MRAPPGKTDAGATVAVVVHDARAMRTRFQLESNFRPTWTQPHAVRQHLGFAQSRHHRGTAGDDGVRLGQVRDSIPHVRLGGAAEYDMITVRIDRDQVGRIACINFHELGDAWVADYYVLSADRRDAQVVNERASADASAVDDDRRLVEGLVETRHRAEFKRTAGFS